MKRWTRCVPLLSMTALSACVRLHAPDPFVLGEKSISARSGSAEVVTQIPAHSVAGTAEPALGTAPSGPDDDDAWVRVRTASPNDPVKGVCVLMPGILGSHSSPTCERNLRGDGWHVVVVAPPLVSAVLAELRGADAGNPADLGDRGARVGRAVDAVVCRALAKRRCRPRFSRPSGDDNWFASAPANRCNGRTKTTLCGDGDDGETGAARLGTGGERGLCAADRRRGCR